MTTPPTHVTKATLLALLGVAVFAMPGLAQEAIKPSDRPVGASFVENFDRLDRKTWVVSHGWNNGKHQNCDWSKRQVALKDGIVKMRYSKQKTKQREFACAEIQTKTRFTYGSFEVRMKSAAGPGLNSAMFTYIGPVHKQPWDEIDFEVLGKDPSKVQLNQYIDGKGGNEKLADVPGGADKGFHDYAFVWEKQRLRYYIDGELVHTVDDPAKIPSHAAKIYVSLWASETLPGWLGTFKDPGEQFVEVDRIAYTALGDECQFPESVVCAGE